MHSWVQRIQSCSYGVCVGCESSRGARSNCNTCSLLLLGGWILRGRAAPLSTVRRVLAAYAIAGELWFCRPSCFGVGTSDRTRYSRAPGIHQGSLGIRKKERPVRSAESAGNPSGTLAKDGGDPGIKSRNTSM